MPASLWLSSLAAILALSRFSVDKALPLNTVEGVVTIGAMALTAFTGSQMAVRAQRRAEEAELRREEMEKLNQFGSFLLGANTLARKRRRRSWLACMRYSG